MGKKRAGVAFDDEWAELGGGWWNNGGNLEQNWIKIVI